MNTRDKTLIVGVGSAHGDDQAGWLVADELTRRIPDREFISVRKASVPLDFLDWVENVKVLHLIDAFQDSGGEKNVRRFRWLNGQLICHSSGAPESSMLNPPAARSSHGFSVPDVLRLAEQTGMLPEITMVWAIPGSHFQPGARMSDPCQNNICMIATQIMAELSVAYA
jgi:hydrogenase maturation protease